MIILNSLKSITVITATVVLSYFIWNKIVAWEKTAKCGAPDFSHFTETCLRGKLLSSPSSVRELERHSPLWQWPCRWEPLWKGATFSTGRRKAQLQCLRASPSSTESTAEEAAWEPVSLCCWNPTAANSSFSQQLTHSLPHPSARCPVQTGETQPSLQATTDPQHRKSHRREAFLSSRGFQEFA